MPYFDIEGARSIISRKYNNWNFTLVIFVGYRTGLNFLFGTEKFKPVHR